MGAGQKRNNMEQKRLTLFAGHYGSGKTNIAVNYALKLAKEGKKVCIADLDIVNPYFRTKDSAEELEQNGIRLIVSEFANSNVDIPALPQDMYAITDDRSLHVIIDVGGDDRGAFALGRYTPDILEENDFEMSFVVNFARPLTSNIEDAIEIMREIEFASKIPFNSITNNTNIGEATSADTVLHFMPFVTEFASRVGLPIVRNSVRCDIADSLKGKIDMLFPLNLQKKLF